MLHRRKLTVRDRSSEPLLDMTTVPSQLGDDVQADLWAFYTEASVYGQEVFTCGGARG